MDSPDATPSESNPFHEFHRHLAHARNHSPHNGDRYWRGTGMDVGVDDRTLRRIIAMLVALAVLAERASARSFPVRWLVLTLLRYAEGVARGFVVEATQWEWPGLEDDLEPGSSPLDAALLGLRLRLLTAVLGALLPAADRLYGPNACIDRARHRLAPHVNSLMADGWHIRAYDTS